MDKEEKNRLQNNLVKLADILETCIWEALIISTIIEGIIKHLKNCILIYILRSNVSQHKLLQEHPCRAHAVPKDGYLKNIRQVAFK